MKRFFDKVLLGLLWLIAAILALTFWMSARYGFNVLSVEHWAYLSELQAQRAHVKPDFYISLIFALVITLLGLYLIVRPHRKKIVLEKPTTQPATTIESTTPEPIKETVSAARRPMSPSGLGFGTRNSVPTPQKTDVYTPQIITPPTPNIEPEQNPLFNEISAILESAGYIIKKCNKIGALRRPVLAVGYNQNILIASSNISPSLMQDAIESLVAIFDDTLGDTAQDIVIHGYIVNPTDKEDFNPDLIATFDSPKALQEQIEPNEKPEDFDSDLFDAFSTYIDTVSGYIGK